MCSAYIQEALNKVVAGIVIRVLGLVVFVVLFLFFSTTNVYNFHENVLS